MNTLNSELVRVKLFQTLLKSCVQTNSSAVEARIQKLERVLLRVKSGKKVLSVADLTVYTDELSTLKKGV